MIFKCKTCGGTIEFEPGATVGVCDYCGTKQTLPKTSDDVIANLFNRANNLRLKCEFDKAEQVYEKIVQQDDSEAEAHWGIVLCKYGIEYVEDPKTLRRIPTCHRTLFDAVTKDPDYLAAIDYSDASQQNIYEAEARAIDRIQKDILAIVENEKPFDVFLCYKETDENGKRTVDSTVANDIYYQLTAEGFKVFFAAITLEDKLGQEYEPYIFAALNSAKVMLVIGTKPEYFSAVWVKNEWSRYLKLMKSDRSKLLIPCYRDMDAYDLPDEFSHLQAQDMGKIGFINDVVRGIKKVIGADASKAPAKETVVISESSANIEPLLRRAFLFLEDGNWEEANAYCERVLDQDPENAKAYVGKLMAELKVKKMDQLTDQKEPFDENSYYQKALRFADEGLRSTLTGYVSDINERNEAARLDALYEGAKCKMAAAKCETDYISAAEVFEGIADWKDSATLAKDCRYAGAKQKMVSASLEKDYISAAESFEDIADWKDSAAKAQECREKAETARKSDVYRRAINLMTSEDETKIMQAIPLFESIPGWINADELVDKCPEYAYDAKNSKIYNEAIALSRRKDITSLSTAIKKLQEISGWKDADAQAENFLLKIEEIKAKEEADRLEAERKTEERRIAAEKALKKRKKTIAITVSIVAAFVVFLIVLLTVIIPTAQYNRAVEKYGLGWVDTIENASVGEVILLGEYEQDKHISSQRYS